MKSRTKGPANSLTAASGTPDELAHAFDALALLRPPAKNILDAEMHGENVSATKVKELARKVGEAILAFEKAWDNNTTQIVTPMGERIAVFTADFLSLQNFLKSNHIRTSAEHLIIGNSCQLDKHGFIAGFLLVTKHDFDSIFNTEHLENLKRLRGLGLNGSLSDTRKLARLTFLETLEVCTNSPAGIANLAALKLKELRWTYFPSNSSARRKRTLDLSPFAAIKTLEEMRINCFSLKQEVMIQSFAPLKSLCGLKKLKLVGVKSGSQLGAVTLPQITDLVLDRSAIEDLSWLISFPSLKTLEIYNSFLRCKSAKYPPKLTTINIENCNSEIAAGVLRPMLELAELDKVVLSGAHFSAEALSIIEQLGNKVRIKRPI